MAVGDVGDKVVENKSEVDVKGIATEFLNESDSVWTEKQIRSVLSRSYAYRGEEVSQALRELAEGGEFMVLYPDGINSGNSTPENTYYVIKRDNM